MAEQPQAPVFTGPQYLPGAEIIKTLITIPFTIMIIGICLMCIVSLCVSKDYSERLLAREIRAVLIFSPSTWFGSDQPPSEEVASQRWSGQKQIPVSSSSEMAMHEHGSDGVWLTEGPHGAENAPVIARARTVQIHAAKFFPLVVEAEQTGMGLAFQKWCIRWLGDSVESHWNNRVRQNFINIIPMMWVRLELLLISTLVFFPTLVYAYAYGERRARIRMREGYRKGDHRVTVALWIFRLVLFVSWIGIFIPLMPPLVYWLVPSLAITWFGVHWVRANLIEP